MNTYKSFINIIINKLKLCSKNNIYIMSTTITLFNVNKLFSENNTKKYLPVDVFLKEKSCTEKKTN